MAWIQNVSLADIQKGYHYDAGPNSLFIQIVDPDMEFPKPKYKFKEIRKFKFLDIEDECHPDAIQRQDAICIANALLYAKVNRMNVTVHCHAGICRSGAVAEVGVILGFQDTDTYRCPNLLVKKMLLDVIGMNYLK